MAATRLQELEMEDPVSEMEWSPYPGKKEDHAAAAANTMPAHGTGDNESEFDDEFEFDECDDDDEEFGGMQSPLAHRVAKRPSGVLAFRRRRDQAAKRRLGGQRRQATTNNKKAAFNTHHGKCNHDSNSCDGGDWLHQHDDDLGCCCAMHSADSAARSAREGHQEAEARRLREVVEAMPQEAWLNVVRHLTDVRDVEMSVALVSHRFFQLTRENLLWKKLAKRKWGPFLKWIGEKRWTANFDWRKYYMQRSLLDQPDALRWEYPSIQGPKPSPRFVQTASLVGDSEIVFIGGKQNEESRLDEIHILDTNTMHFKEPTICGEPVPPIARHTATVVGNRVFIVGGYGSTYFHDLSMLDMGTMTWSTPVTRGKRPRHRSNHAAVAIGTKIFVFGGSTDDEEGNYVTLGDFFMLDTETFEWTELTAENCAGPFPEGRAGHRMVAIRDKLFLFGGGVWDKSRRSWLAKINATHVFDPLTRTWIKPQMKDNVLPDTCTFTSIFSVGLFMFACFGQSMRQFTVNDHVYALDTIAMEWRRVQPGGPVQPLSRDMASATVVGDRVYFMGGNCAGLLVDHNFCALAFPPLLKQ